MHYVYVLESLAYPAKSIEAMRGTLGKDSSNTMMASVKAHHGTDMEAESVHRLRITGDGPRFREVFEIRIWTCVRQKTL